MNRIDPRLIQGSPEREDAFKQLETMSRREIVHPPSAEHPQGLIEITCGIDLSNPEVAELYHYLMSVTGSMT